MITRIQERFDIRKNFDVNVVIAFWSLWVSRDEAKVLMIESFVFLSYMSFPGNFCWDRRSIPHDKPCLSMFKSNKGLRLNTLGIQCFS